MNRDKIQNLIIESDTLKKDFDTQNISKDDICIKMLDYMAF